MQRFLLFIVLLTFLSLRLFFFYSERHVYQSGEGFVKEYTFLKEAKHNNTSQYFFTDSVLVTLPLYPRYEYGDTVKLEGKVKASKDKDLLIVENPKVTEIAKMSPFLAVTKFVRQRVSQSVLAVLPGKEGGLLLGIVLGVRDKIPNDYYDELKSVGVLHIVAASGANVSIVAGFLLPILQGLVKRRLAIIFTASIIIFYALLAGFDPPIVRASVMALLSYTALLLGRKQAAILLLFLSGWLMIMFSPQLVEDISFQLSFAATLGIMVIKPLLDPLFSPKFLSILKEDISTTVAAQITTFPILLSSFGAFPLTSFPVNFLVLWTVPLLMGLAGVGALISLIFPPLSYPFYIICYPFLYYFGLVVKVGSGINFSITTSFLPLPLIMGYYLFLLAVVIKKKEK